MSVPAERSRAWRVCRRIGSGVAEFVGEAVLEGLLTIVSCLVLAGLALAFLWGLGHSPVVTGAVTVAAVVFLGYGGWVVLRPAAKRRRRGWLAGAAGAVFTVAVVVAVYGSSCGCS